MSAAFTTRVVLVRHGRTAWNARGIWQGWQDVPLDDVGRAEARALAAALRDVPFDAAYTSPLARARETAAAVLADRRLVPLALDGLRELSYGALEGLEPAARRARWAELEARWAADPWAVTFPGGESLDALAARAAAAWERIVAAHPGETVLVVGHGHLNRVLLLHAEGRPRADFAALAQPNCHVVTLDCAPAPRAMEAA